MEPLIRFTVRRYRTSGTAPDESLSRDAAGPLVYLDDVERWLLKRAHRFAEEGHRTAAGVIEGAAKDLVAPPDPYFFISAPADRPEGVALPLEVQPDSGRERLAAIPGAFEKGSGRTIAILSLATARALRDSLSSCLDQPGAEAIDAGGEQRFNIGGADE